MKHENGALRQSRMEKYVFIAIAAGFGALAAIIKALHEKAGFWGAMLDALLAFVLCGASAAFIMHWLTWPPEVVGGLVGVIGLYSKRISGQIETTVDAIGRAARKRIEKFNDK